MKTFRNSLGGVVMAALSLSGVLLVGCSDQTQHAASDALDSAALDTRHNVAVADQKMKQVGDAAAAEGREAAIKSREAEKTVGKDVKGDAHYVGKAVGGTVKRVDIDAHDAGKVVTMTPKVKDALIRSNVDTTALNVDTDAKDNVVLLKGSVPSQAQKAEASQIAEKTIANSGKDFTVKNELLVK